MDYIVKPVRHDTLLRSADMALRQKALLAAKESYRINLEAIFRSVKDAIITLDKKLNVLEVNDAAHKLCGIRREEALGNLLEDSTLGCRRACLKALRKTIALGERVDIHHLECHAPHNAEQIVSIAATPLLKGKEGSSGVVMVVRDETRLVELERSLQQREEIDRIVGKSACIRDVLSMIESLADVQTSVLVTGESGTGKELVAEALHDEGNRNEKPLVKVNCSALSENLLESELFGHVRGAFTGAIKDKVGRFQRADGGTIFLDEIGEISPRMQLRFLRVLETMEFEKVGDSTPIRVDTRVVAATNRDLKEKVARGEFREDLYYRLKVVEIKMPTLKTRRDDIPLLVNHFLQKFNKKFGKSVHSVSDSVLDLFLHHHWPGNVRELENTLEHAFVLCRHSTITERELPSDFMKSTGREHHLGPAGGSAESLAIEEALKRASFNKSKAARLLGMSRRTLYRKLEQNGLKT
jgi:PAS domain S-box-containing protein